MFENKKEALVPKEIFYKRVLRNVIIASLLILVCLIIGILGYHFTDNVPWIDSLHNASMILSGMGPVVELKSNGAKIFSSAYALFSGVIFLSIVGFILAPAIHRIFHRLIHER